MINADLHGDDRGFFLESYHKKRFAEHGIVDDFVQDNHSGSKYGVLRGIHYQDMSAPMAKLVRCSAGSILDVAVDLRSSAPTFGRWVAVELSDKNAHQLLIPVGFGHAFLTLSESADVQYKCTGYYQPSAEGAVLWIDPELAISWPIAQPVVSARDQKAMSLRDYSKRPAFR